MTGLLLVAGILAVVFLLSAGLAILIGKSIKMADDHADLMRAHEKRTTVDSAGAPADGN